MPNTWFTADLHLGHANIIKYCLRPFLSPAEEELALSDPHGRWRVSDETVQRHDDFLVDSINAVVQRADTLWVLGDFCWGKFDVARQYRDRIACRNVHLVRGNHDHGSILPVFDHVIEQGMVTVEGQNIWLNHYPMRSWNKSSRGSWHLYGHVHGRFSKEDEQTLWRLTRDVGADASDFQPVGFPSLQSYMAPRIQAFAHHKKRVERTTDSLMDNEKEDEK
jgi:calcineurin-like phosphoesterase family protein